LLNHEQRWGTWQQIGSKVVTSVNFMSHYFCNIDEVTQPCTSTNNFPKIGIVVARRL
jgi:hypothetical protein